MIYSWQILFVLYLVSNQMKILVCVQTPFPPLPHPCPVCRALAREKWQCSATVACLLPFVSQSCSRCHYYINFLPTPAFSCSFLLSQPTLNWLFILISGKVSWSNISVTYKANLTFNKNVSVKHKKQANKYILKIWSSWCRDDIVMIQTFVGPSAGEANWDQMAHCCFVDDGNDGLTMILVIIMMIVFFPSSWW